MRKNINDAGIFAAVCNNKVGIFNIIANILFVHGFYGVQILAINALDAATAIANIALYAAEQAHIRIYLNIDLEIQQVAHGFIIENMNTFQQNHFGRRNFFAGIAAPMLGIS